MRKIILDCDLMRYKDSGLYHYCLNLGVNVKRILDRDQQEKISFYVPSAEKKSFGDDAGCIIERKWHQKLIKPFMWDCDIWHAPFQSGRIFPKNNKRTRILLTIHDLNCLHEDKSDKERIESLRHTQNLIDRADAMVCISHHCKKDVLTHLNVKQKPIHVIHNGTHNVNNPPAKPGGFKPSRPFIFTLGYVNRKKNFHTLVPLLANTDFDLIVAGKLDEIDYVNKMRQLARKLGVSERLHILGPVSEEDKAWYFSNCAAFMLPSLAEGFGAPVVEAMKFGKPLFLSNLTSLPEIGGDVAFYFNDFEPEHMQQVFNDGLIQFQKNGLADKIIKRVNEFSWEEKAIEYIELYRSML
ncbi:MAG: glycosyltransferase family 4 protein [Chitinophagaceae bacterium]|nr:glycosyltransferase family 4 protein [Chitinophagaceae bacterium]